MLNIYDYLKASKQIQEQRIDDDLDLMGMGTTSYRKEDDFIYPELIIEEYKKQRTNKPLPLP